VLLLVLRLVMRERLFSFAFLGKYYVMAGFHFWGGLIWLDAANDDFEVEVEVEVHSELVKIPRAVRVHR
jgi:hypothetical protein